MTEEPKPKKPRSRSLKGEERQGGRKKGGPVSDKQRETQFGGPRGNVPGLSHVQAVQRYENGKKAERIQGKWLDALLEAQEKLGPEALDTLRADTLRLITDALDRANGKAVAAVEVTSPDGSMSPPEAIRIIAVRPEDDAS